MVQVRIERTPRGLPALREAVFGDNRSLIVLNEKGKRKRGNAKHLVRIQKNDLAIVCIYHNNKYFINIYKILEIDADQGFMYVDKVNNYQEGIWDDTLPEYLTAAVEKAKKLATSGEEV